MKVLKSVQTILAATVLSVSLAACSDFFKDNKNQNPAPNNDNVGESKPGNGPLPPEFQNPNAGEFSEIKMLINIGINVLAKAADNFKNQTPVLSTSIGQYCDALASGLDASEEEARAQQDWKRAMTSFQEIAAIPLGPLLEKGLFLSHNLYSWPLLNTCGIDETAFKNSSAPQMADQQFYNTRGLGAVEYLLHESTLTSTCNLKAKPHMGNWNEKEARAKKLDRCLWAKELSEDISVKANLLASAWNPTQENYSASWIRSNSAKEVLNGLTDAMGMIEVVKDDKLGKTLGRYKNCPTDTCPNDVENRFSGASLDSVLSNLKAFRAVFVGGYAVENAFGIDDLLVKSGRQDVAQSMVLAIDKAIQSLSAVRSRGSLEQQILEMDPAQCKATTQTERLVEICAVHADVREVAFLLKTQVLAALALRAPPSHQGDND